MSEPNLPAQPATMTATIQVTRAATGKVEDWTLTFTPAPEQAQEEPTTDTQEDANVRHP